MQMDGDESSNIEDRRGEGGGFGGGGFGGGGFGGPGIGLPLGGGLFRGGFGLIAIVVIGLILGINPLSLLGLDGGSGYVEPSQTRSASRPAGNADPETQFVARVLKSTEDEWSKIFQEMGRQYRQPRLVLYRDATQTACGGGQSAMGPFYCPPDQRVYIDLSVFHELARRFHAPRQFPQAYCIAHEVRHHRHKLLGISRHGEPMR